jgi:DNA processing protein
VDDPLLWIALRDSPQLSRTEARDLLRAFGCPGAIFGRPEKELDGLCSEGAAKFLARDPRLGRARLELERAREAGFEILMAGRPGFPPLLDQIQDPPTVLYVAGCLPQGPLTSVVGSRRATARGRETALRFAAALTRAGAAVVSGLAYGIDAAAHTGALEAGGATVAVLASGLDRPGPSGNVPLARRILRDGGAWISEHPPGTCARPYYFPDRNRLISGISRATLIVEARERSGSLWTARHAVDQAREVLVVPGPIDSDSCRGSNRLLVEGATPVVDPQGAVVAALGSLDPRPVAVVDPSASPAPEGDAARILRRVWESPCGPDDLVRELGLPAARVLTLVSELELDGLLTRDGRRIASGPRAVRPSGG